MHHFNPSFLLCFLLPLASALNVPAPTKTPPPVEGLTAAIKAAQVAAGPTVSLTLVPVPVEPPLSPQTKKNCKGSSLCPFTNRQTFKIAWQQYQDNVFYRKRTSYVNAQGNSAAIFGMSSPSHISSTVRRERSLIVCIVCEDDKYGNGTKGSVIKKAYVSCHRYATGSC